MKGLDTNVLVRVFVGDDLAQAERARRYLARQCCAREPGHVNRVTICDFVWVLESAYGYSRRDIAALLERMTAAIDLDIEDGDAARAALRAYRAGHEFADALVGETNRAAGCAATATFDRKASRLPTFEPV